MPGIFGFDRIEIIDEPLDAGQRLPVIAVPQIALDTLQLARDVFGFSWVLMRQSLGVLPEDGQPYGDMKPVKDVLGTGDIATAMLRTLSPPSVRKVISWFIWKPCSRRISCKRRRGLSSWLWTRPK
jgi:hypothetical protein